MTNKTKADWYLVINDFGQPEHGATWPEACHEHINEAISEHDIDEAAKWKVVPVVRADVHDELVAALYKIASFAPGNGDVCEIIANTARAALAKAEAA